MTEDMDAWPPSRPPKTRNADSGSRWVPGAVVLAAACCAGPALFAAVAAGSVGAVLGAWLGIAALAIPAAAVLVVAVVLIRRRRKAHALAPHDDATCTGRCNC